MAMTSRSARARASCWASLTEWACGAAIADSGGAGFVIPGVVPEVMEAGPGDPWKSGPDAIGVFTEVRMHGYSWPLAGQTIFFFETTEAWFSESC